MDRVTRRKTGQPVGCVFIVFFLFVLTAALPATNAYADLSGQGIRETVQESMKAILTGQKYSLELEQKQLILRNMFEKGVIRMCK